MSQLAEFTVLLLAIVCIAVFVAFFAGLGWPAVQWAFELGESVLT